MYYNTAKFLLMFTDEGLLCDCMIIADGVLEYKALKALDYYHRKLPSNASKVYEVVNE